MGQKPIRAKQIVVPDYMCIQHETSDGEIFTIIEVTITCAPFVTVAYTDGCHSVHTTLILL